MGTFKFFCSECHCELETQDEWKGAQLNCPSCGKTITVPSSHDVPNTNIMRRLQDVPSTNIMRGLQNDENDKFVEGYFKAIKRSLAIWFALVIIIVSIILIVLSMSNGGSIVAIIGAIFIVFLGCIYNFWKFLLSYLEGVFKNLSQIRKSVQNIEKSCKR